MTLGRAEQKLRRLLRRLRASFPIRADETPQSEARPPILIGGTGGSGTRVVAEIAGIAGVFIGRHLNLSNDAMETVPFADRWIARSMAVGHSLSDEQDNRMAAELHRTMARHRAGMPDPGGPWAVKNPRLMLILPLFHRVYPDFKFVHVIRDGRDIAFSQNQLQLKDFERFVLEECRLRQPLPVRSIAFWAATNLAARSYGKDHLGANYCCLRFEELCRTPHSVIAQLFDFLNVEPRCLEIAAAGVHPPSSIGRWRRQPAEIVAELHEAGKAGLVEFGYLE